ncbi:hypothetical protein CY34DRAFT_805181 [Suillus luteus UH-Slu-Lm8-n1]|uniref:Protein kinase domain-containing protein n=1 Tax=Suillus luteus UH-Slu-Lm8-n1 TaxID=930992 RepID=A0A0D0AWG7_9AGAM|nr:hypothetical protein CY34DRAFT_805181 [Suillus luteus UH-Slu-Lm8-n1]
MAPKYPEILGYELIQQMGGGIFSSVFRVFNREKHQMTACTMILRSRLPRRNTTPYEAEPINVWGIGIILFTLRPSNPSSSQSFQ